MLRDISKPTSIVIYVKNRIGLKNFYNKDIEVKKESDILMKVWLQPPIKAPLMKHIENKHGKKRPKIAK